jgi:MOSC domain-containing protein YiiM
MADSTCIDDEAGRVVAVCRDGAHRFSKSPARAIDLVAGIGIVGDAHAGRTVQHRSRIKASPHAPNLRQVHLIHAELFAAMSAHGFSLHPGDLGENVTTSGIELLALPKGTLLHCGGEAVIEVTGLRNPCAQIEAFAPGLLGRLARKRTDGTIERLAGIMGIVRHGGRIVAGDAIAVHLPSGPRKALQPV